jgi:hypothetical protein
MRARHPSMKHHFARVAPRYRQMRDLDVTAVLTPLLLRRNGSTEPSFEPLNQASTGQPQVPA